MKYLGMLIVVNLLFISSVFAQTKLTGSISSENLNTLSSHGYGLAIDDFTLDSPLPVELQSFSGFLNYDKPDLDWATSAELNICGFEVGRKVLSNSTQGGEQNNNHWNKIRFVNGNSNSSSPKAYSFTGITIISTRRFIEMKKMLLLRGLILFTKYF